MQPPEHQQPTEPAAEAAQERPRTLADWLRDRLTTDGPAKDTEAPLREPNPAERRAHRFRKGIASPPPRKRQPREQAMRRAFEGIHSLEERSGLYAIAEQRMIAIRTGRAIDPGHRDPQERRRKREIRRAQEASS